MKLNELTIKQAHAGLKKKEFSSVDLTTACLDQIEKTNPTLNSFITITKAEALEKAHAVDQAADFSNPLTGIPVAVKDMFCTKDVRSTAGSKILENYTPPYSATAFEKLDAAGVVLVGKTNMDEFACGSSTESSYFGAAKNPWDTARVPGGSSGGSAVAVAAQQALCSLGTDTGGSIRQPAALTGIVGIKPTYGRVSRYGVMAMASSLDHIGHFAKTIEDAALILETTAGYDPKDSTTPNMAVPRYSELLTQDIKGLKIGIPKEYFIEGIDPAVEQAARDAIKTIEGLGAHVQEVSLPHTAYGLAVYYIIMPSELSSNLARYDGVRYGTVASGNTLLDQYLATRATGFGAEIRRRIMLGTYALSAGYFDAYYKQAAKVRTLICRDFGSVFQQVDCIITPTTPTVAFKLGEKVDDPLTMYLNDIFTVTANIAGVPGLSMPCGFAKPKDGEGELPVGLQIIGKQFDEATILRVGHQFEQATSHRKYPQID